MPIAVHLIELAYVLIIISFIILFYMKNVPLLEGGFLLLIICSPYSISIIPFRQDTIELYGLYSNSGLLNLFNFYKVAGLSILDLIALLVIVKNFKLALKMPIFFKFFYILISFFSIIAYAISAYLIWSPELDNVIRALSVFKSIIYIISIYCVIEKICSRIGFKLFLKILMNIILTYCIINCVLLSFLPSWYTWVKYSFNYLFLDQTDQFLVFLFCLLTFWGPLSKLYRYKLYAFLLCIMLFLSGGKAGVYSIMILAMGWLYQKSNIKGSNLGVIFLCAMIFSWLLSYFIGVYELDISIYSRYFQVQQLFLNYSNNILLVFFGIGPSKAYIFYDFPTIFDPGAYTSEELSSSFRLGFQMPYLSWIKNFGLSGVILLLLALNYIIKVAWSFKKDDIFFSGAVYSLGLYFILIGFMDFPAFGLKT
ncbi:hypothetical protein E1B32_22300, partial [Salmonella enterica subsp. enterica serovar Champaign]|nr:hypothetical protein [Salmonella enterica subsp. enterica serovar Wandsworth]ECD4893197.1 hypothetical protein [Salmonella enterica subsp. enterica serovar Champaign]